MSTPPLPYPDVVLRHAMGFQPARILLTALDLGLFQLLARSPANESTIRESLGLHVRGTQDFLRALVLLGLLEEVDGRYGNSPATTAYLVPGGATYLGTFLHMVNGAMYPAWARLADGLRTGQPQSGAFSTDDIFGEWYGDDEQGRELIEWTEEITRPVLLALATEFDWSTRRSVLDLGSMRGNVLAHLVRTHPHLDACGFDLPQVEPAFHENMARLGLAGRVGFHGGDFFADPLPAAEVVLLGHVLVDWSDEERRQLVKNTFPAVAPGGVLVIYDPMVAGDDNDLANVIRSLNLQLMTPRGSTYPVADCLDWLTDAGYVDLSHRPLAHHVTLVVAHKPG